MIDAQMRKQNRYYYNLRALGETDPRPQYYTYLYIDPINEEVFYVGKGTAKRIRDHYNEAKAGRYGKGCNGKLMRRIQELIKKGVKPAYEKVIEDVDEITALALEAAYIDFYGIENLCNYQPSGFGCTNHNPEIKQKIREATLRQRKDPVIMQKMLVAQERARIQQKIDRYGSLEAYDALQREKEQLRVFKKAMGLLVLDVTTGQADKRKKAKEIEREKRYESVKTCDKVNKIFIRTCPQCKGDTRYSTFKIMMKCARKKTKCYSCIGRKVKPIGPVSIKTWFVC